MSVFALPPNESDMSCVSSWLRYGTCELLPDERAEMTSPSAVSDLLIDCASLSRSPLAPVPRWSSHDGRHASCDMKRSILIILTLAGATVHHGARATQPNWRLGRRTERTNGRTSERARAA